jgi:hypothetical protein
MTRSKLSTKVLLLATGIGLSTAAFAGSRPAAAQDTFPAYNVALGACPAGTVYDPIYGCTTAGADDFGYYGYPTVLRGHTDHRSSDPAWGGVRDIAHGFYHDPGRGMGGLGHMDRGVSATHFRGDGFADRGVNVAHLGAGGFAHGMGVGHVGGFGGHGMGGGFHGGGGFGGGGHR